MNHAKIHNFRRFGKIPAIDVDLLNDDGKCEYPTIVIPMKRSGFSVLKRNKDGTYMDTTLGRSPIVDISKYFSSEKIGADQYKIVFGQFALAIADMMYIMKDLLKVEFASPLLDASFRNNKNKSLMKFIKASTEYLLNE